MQLKNRKKLFDLISDKKIIIWGARMTGIGALRQLKEKNIEVLSFIDSDHSLVGKLVHGYEVYHPKNIKKILENNENVIILVAVSLKEEEILKQFEKMNIKNLPVVSFYDEMSPYYTVDILGSCNLKCASCPHSIAETDVPKGSMRLDVFKNVFDKIMKETPSISHLSLYSWGEPLLNPYIVKLID